MSELLIGDSGNGKTKKSWTVAELIERRKNRTPDGPPPPRKRIYQELEEQPLSAFEEIEREFFQLRESVYESEKGLPFREVLAKVDALQERLRSVWTPDDDLNYSNLVSEDLVRAFSAFLWEEYPDEYEVEIEHSERRQAFQRAGAKTTAEVLRDRPPRSGALSTGIAGLDDACRGGWRPGKVYVLAGPPERGKTALALHLARHFAREHRATIAVFPHDADSVQAATMIGMGFGYEQDALEDDFGPYEEMFRRDTAGLEVYYFDKHRSGHSLEILEEILPPPLKSGRAPFVVVIDSPQRVRLREKGRALNEQQRVELAMVMARGIAEKYPAIVIVCAQANRASFAHKDDAENIRSEAAVKGGSAEYDTDFQAWLERDSKEPGLIRLFISKNRGAESDLTLLLAYDQSKATFNYRGRVVRPGSDAAASRSEHKEKALARKASQIKRHLEKLTAAAGAAEILITELKEGVGGSRKLFYDALDSRKDWFAVRQDGPKKRWVSLKMNPEPDSSDPS